MTTSDTGVLGVMSVEQRKGAMSAEFYPTHTMLPDIWYFLGHAVGHKNLEAHVAVAKSRASDAVHVDLAEKHKGRYGSKQLVSNLDLMGRRYNILERETGSLSVPFLGTETLEVNLQLQGGGMTDLLRQDEGLARDEARVRAH